MKPEVLWPKTKTVYNGQQILISGKALPDLKVKVVVKAIPGNTASNSYDLVADMNGNFSVQVEIPEGPKSLYSEAFIVVSAFGFDDTNSCAFSYSR